MFSASALAGAVVALACGCGRSTGQPAPDPGGQQPATAVAGEAQDLFLGRCASCHGYEGRGDGPQVGDLKARPRDLSRFEWQRGVTDDQLRTLIVRGGAAVGKSDEMPGNPDLAARTPVLDGLVATVRGLARP